MSLKNFMSYDDAATVLGEYADKVNELKSGLTNLTDDVKLNTQDLTTVSRSKNNIVMTVESVKKGNQLGTWNGNTYTRDGITYELLTDDGVVINGINVSGNNDGYLNFNLCSSLNLGAGRYTLSQQDNLNNDSCYATVSTDGSYKAWASGHHGSESYDSISGLCTFTLVCHNFNNANPVTVYPMNRISTETDSTFAPYIPSVDARLEAVEERKIKWFNIEVPANATEYDMSSDLPTGAEVVSVLPTGGAGLTIVQYNVSQTKLYFASAPSSKAYARVFYY